MALRETSAMIAAMSPELRAGKFVFVTTADAGTMAACGEQAVAMVREAEGCSYVLPVEVARMLGFGCDQPMRQITLSVFSALEGVGLTAAVASALAARGIACNMIAAFHHDHAFVPADRADAALAALRELQAGAAAGQREAVMPSPGRARE